MERVKTEADSNQFTLQEVSKHNKLSDGWIVVQGKVYDITNFAQTHPGFSNSGQVSTALAITRCLGTDCTDEFQSIHSPKAWQQLADFQIGLLAKHVGAESTATPPPHPYPTWLEGQRSTWLAYSVWHVLSDRQSDTQNPK
ncbi:hypothetical protein CYMTET_54227 [Cymbomonas tetramitiformis]|uniref:Cytochrome b5 heme-binding domain-containing protein n=1 Tax=Cymbomonas tetramitiformis TaxID=36881 RepID=A0AAE0BH48_9CHLO|nr:hypothetical protein CYMTET_54227 [Cymbomonas tetramitiformis]